PYGSAFPLDDWISIRDYLKRGGDLVVLGGAPFHQPVLRTANGWQLGTRQPAFARELLIGPAEPVKFDGRTIWELTIRLGTEPEVPSESGSQAIVDAHVRPLELLKDADGIARACALVEIDHDKGGRWIFATSDAALSAVRIHDIIAGVVPPSRRPPGRPEAGTTPSAPKLTVSKDWLRKNGKVFPIVGTTYMSSDVHRFFLFQPNPQLWDEDFALMQKAGINFVRTGLWTDWDKAHGDDSYKALDAYVAAAAKHDIVVCFTFFAFQPLWAGGTNPFLDPKSIAKQREFVTTIARRYKGAGWIHYDLINEPSYAPADKLWQNRPIGDEWEKRAWRNWVHEHRGDNDAELRNLWHEPGDLYALPGTPQKTSDFTLFTNDAVAKWAKTLRDAIRAEDPEALVTLGQDEGGTSTRPSQQLHAESVDYTSTHPWWQNDDVLPNGLFAKAQ
ncbi:MAG TPA: cellulase family glycosylhydrolase, partial [Thermoanaerobaculia bacterium]|nr:cellulase family glycosylhydrolase [Thermoanaerobaculia bacterium]